MGKGIFVTFLALLCFASTVFTQEVNKVSEAPAPSPHHRSNHHHHDHHHRAPAKSPVHPPAHPPVHPPAQGVNKVSEAPAPSPLHRSHHRSHHHHPSAHPPVHPPAKSPIHPPAHSPAHSPAKPPAHPPTKLPAKPPVHPPATSPVKPPVYPPKFSRSQVAVQGVVFCKDCKYSGVETLMGAKPVKGAVVRLMCKNKRQSLAETQTDEKGYFLLLGPKTLSNYGFESCRVYLVKSPVAQCSKVAKLNGGHLGGVLKPVNSPVKPFLVVNNLKYGLFNVGPFAFEPACPR